MKKLIVLFFSLLTLICSAQNKADIIVTYDYNHATSRNQTKTDKMTLLANDKEAKYFNEISLWADSLQATPGGKAKYMEYLKKTSTKVSPNGSIVWDLSKGTSKQIYTYVFTNLNDKSLTIYDKWADELGYYKEPIDEIKWNINNEKVTNILGYQCILAESDYHGRHWKVWFSPEIPVNFGPWKLRGLPGLILRAEGDKDFVFNATGMENTNRQISQMFLSNEYSKIDRKEALSSEEKFQNNLEANLSAKGGIAVSVIAVDKDKNKITPPKFDGLKHSIEPDYKKR